MPLPSKKERDKKQKGSIAEEFKLSQEDLFEPRTLEKTYWANPNSSTATIARTSYESNGCCCEVIEHQGIKT